MQDNDEMLFQALASPGMAVSGLPREDWIMVGMALKEGGYPVSVWDDWSRNDSRYKPGECDRLWNGFTGGSGKKVTVASIIQKAEENGWTYHREPGHVIGFDDEIEWDGESFSGFQPSAGAKNGVEELRLYLQTLFKPDDIIGYVTGDVWENGDKWSPSKGVYTQTAGELLELLEKYPDDLEFTVGSWKPEAGAWIRFNPLDGHGVKNANVTAFRFALVESDTLPLDEQQRVYAELELPIAAMVYSGGKSIHAIVHIDARDIDEYRERVDYLYSYMKNHGIDIDKQNRNPSRLSRMPGVDRNGNHQALIGVNLGRKSWNDWVDFTEGEGDDLPEVIDWGSVMNNIPDPPEELIEGVLRRGHKMLLSATSKAGKSFLLMQLALAISEGREWLGFQCKQGRVLYINLEIDPISFLNRFKNIQEELGWNLFHAEDLRIWNLRGFAKPLDELVPKIVRRIKQHHYSAVVIDPIYKVITGDENNASEMGKFCNQFDKIAKETGCSVIYCHHHSKGAQGAKRAIDRASGSGVFARDPDAQLDVIELQLKPAQRAQLADREDATAFRMEFSLREFRNPKPLNFWFEYPLHRLDQTGELERLHPSGSPEGNLDKSSKRTSEDARLDAMISAWMFLNSVDPDDPHFPTIKQMAKYMDKSEKTVNRYIEEFSDVFMKRGQEVEMMDSE
ncbi:MAG: AAA family ATPase [Mogibacterium sp.]|nr:AAA family ATPase [Mogibacterium sp.]